MSELIRRINDYLAETGRLLDRLDRAAIAQAAELLLECYPQVATGSSVVLSYDNGCRHFVSCQPNNYTLAMSDVDPAVLDGAAHLLRADVWFSQPMLADGNALLFQAARAQGLATSLDINWDPLWGSPEAGLIAFYKWREGAAMMGALFGGHPWGEAPVKLDDPQHPLLKVFAGKGFWVRDEMYKMREPYSRENLRVLLSFDMSKLPADAPTREDKDNAIAWIQQVGKGHVFYCSLGHNRHIFWDPALLQFYLDGIQYALGDLKADATPSAKLNPQPAPVLPADKSN